MQGPQGRKDFMRQRMMKRSFKRMMRGCIIAHKREHPYHKKMMNPGNKRIRFSRI